MDCLALRPLTPILFAALSCAAVCSKDVKPPQPQPVSLEQAEAFAKRLQKPTGKPCDPAALDAGFDVRAMMQLAISRVDASPHTRRRLLQSAARILRFGDRMCADMGEGASFRLPVSGRRFASTRPAT